MRATRFPARAAGPADRLAAFIAHLRLNGVPAGPRETGDALAVLERIDPLDPDEVRRALKALLAADPETWRRFDDLFDAFWFNTGRQKKAEVKADHIRTQSARPTLWQDHFRNTASGGGAPPDDAIPDSGESAAEAMHGRLIASRTRNLSRRDLRELMDDESLRAAEAAAERLARALRDRRSRRRRAATRGRELDLRRMLRASLARGGEPIDLYRRTRPDRPAKIVALCDVSGSMTVYARVFLAFLKGLVAADASADAYIFHTNLMRVTPALRDRDALRAAGRLSLIAEGFGGGTNISGALAQFCDLYAGRAVDSRTVVVILSDGYCTSPPDALAAALARLRKRARRIIWLNPLKGWRDYAPVAAGMSAALPYLDAHLPAHTIESLGALAPEFARV